MGIKLTGDSLSNIILFESNGHANDEDELQQQIDHFSDNVSIVQKMRMLR